jgi:hypothetical protein
MEHVCAVLVGKAPALSLKCIKQLLGNARLVSQISRNARRTRAFFLKGIEEFTPQKGLVSFEDRA